MKPKVLYLATSLNIGGTEQFLASFVEGLHARYDFTIGYLKEKGYFGELLASRGYTVEHFPSLPRLFGYCRKHRFDILHTFLYRANILGRIAGRTAGVPVVVSTQQAMDIWKSRPLIWLDRCTVPLYDAVITNSRAAKEFMQKREKVPAEKICIIYNGIDPATFVPKVPRQEMRRLLGIAPGVPVIACVSRLHWDKGTDYLPEIAKKTPEGVFLVVGDGPQRAQIEDRLAVLGLQKRFVMAGWRQDIPDLLAASDIFLLPSREESFPQVIVEAMGMKLPTVAADIGGVRELVDEGKDGLVVKPGDIDGFARALTSLIKNPQQLAAMSAAGYEKSKHYTRSRIMSDLDALYQRLLTDKNPS